MGDLLDAYDEPMRAMANGPVVVVLGPDGVNVALTPEAVHVSIDHLRAATQTALENRAAGIKPDDAP